MSKFFVDTNVILNWLILTRDKHFSSHSLTDIFYIARKFYSVDERKRFLLLILSNFQVVSENQNDFFDVLNDPAFFDIEDGLQMKCAEKIVVDYIVTENLKDFALSKIPAIDTASALRKVFG